jgi:hypothetical protein
VGICKRHFSGMLSKLVVTDSHFPHSLIFVGKARKGHYLGTLQPCPQILDLNGIVKNFFLLQILDEFVAKGGNFIDTADIYRAAASLIFLRSSLMNVRNKLECLSVSVPSSLV